MRVGALGTVCALGLATAWLCASACSAIVSHADSQCESDSDCARFGAFACVQGGCVAQAPIAEAGGQDAALPSPCATTSECIAARDGVPTLCRQTDHTCVSVLSADCPSVLGDYISDDGVLLGALVPLYGPHQSTGAALADALRLAVSDFDAGIARPDGGTAPLGMVLCNESTDVKRAANHLAGDLVVAAIVGTGDSATTIAAALSLSMTSGQGTLLMSPRAAADLSSVNATGLVWRTCPSYAYESDAIVALADDVVFPRVMAANALTTLHAALLHADDVESLDLYSAIAASLQLNGALATATANDGDFTQADYGDPDELSDVDAAGGYASAVDAVVEAAPLPDVILIVGSTQAVPHVLAAIEQDWPVGARPPQYLLSSGLETAELLTLVNGNASLRSRILGTAPGGSDSNVDAFYGRYALAFPDGPSPQIFGVAQVYDALYALAFAEATTRVSPVMGTNIRDALRRILTVADASAPTAINVGPSAIAPAFGAIAAGQTLALNGASAPLLFDTVTGDVVTDVQVWCIVNGAAAGTVVFQRSGLAYGAASGVLAGAIAASCTAQ